MSQKVKDEPELHVNMFRHRSVLMYVFAWFFFLDLCKPTNPAFFAVFYFLCIAAFCLHAAPTSSVAGPCYSGPDSGSRALHTYIPPTICCTTHHGTFFLCLLPLPATGLRSFDLSALLVFQGWKHKGLLRSKSAEKGTDAEIDQEQGVTVLFHICRVEGHFVVARS